MLILGTIIHIAVESCVEERSVFAIGQNDKETDMETGAKLQQQSTDLVVDKLVSISV